MDGVLIDSMKYHVEAWIKAFARFGYHPDELEFYLNEGVKHPITVRQRLKNLGVDNPDEETVIKIYTFKREIFDQIADVKPNEGVLDLLDILKGKVKLGVVTAAKGIYAEKDKHLEQEKRQGRQRALVRIRWRASC